MPYSYSTPASNEALAVYLEVAPTNYMALQVEPATDTEISEDVGTLSRTHMSLVAAMEFPTIVGLKCTPLSSESTLDTENLQPHISDESPYSVIAMDAATTDSQCSLHEVTGRPNAAKWFLLCAGVFTSRSCSNCQQCTIEKRLVVNIQAEQDRWDYARAYYDKVYKPNHVFCPVNLKAAAKEGYVAPLSPCTVILCPWKYAVDLHVEAFLEYKRAQERALGTEVRWMPENSKPSAAATRIKKKLDRVKDKKKFLIEPESDEELLDTPPPNPNVFTNLFKYEDIFNEATMKMAIEEKYRDKVVNDESEEYISDLTPPASIVHSDYFIRNLKRKPKADLCINDNMPQHPAPFPNIWGPGP
ncbi:hypothetical protein CVT25_015460 [Psilocybe cyanescens]|uniref:Uncharacterized protein n=1 Tax=Psilocybe cyanescens TaxID=93625 RepID=A0A409X521_PSICY|nr:hypothetical protein CVT25_015460 [Psilocybe cyanescens]